MSRFIDRIDLTRPRAVVGWAVLAGLVAGLLAATYFRIAGEPLIDEAIAIEEATAAEAPPTEEEHADDSVEISRSTQRGAGLFGAYAIIGMVFGLLLSVAALSLRGRWLVPFRRVLLAGGILATSLTVVPWFKYPPNPPAVGDPDTASRRQLLYWLLVVITGLLLAGAAHLSARLRRAQWDDVRRGVVVVTGVVIGLAVLLAVLPANTDAIPEAVPASLIWRFRVASLAGNLLLWSLLTVGFATLWTETARRRATASRPAPAPTPASTAATREAPSGPGAVAPGQNSMPFSAEMPSS
jgi:predicted cobalt transporter CbtA